MWRKTKVVEGISGRKVKFVIRRVGIRNWRVGKLAVGCEEGVNDRDVGWVKEEVVEGISG